MNIHISSLIFFFFFLPLIKKMCVRKQKRVSGWKEKARGRERGREREMERQNKSERGLGEISSLADEWEWVMRLTERCKHLHTLRQPWSMVLMPVAWRIRQTGGEGTWKRSASLTVRSALLKGHSTNKVPHHHQPCLMAQDTGDRLAAK